MATNYSALEDPTGVLHALAESALGDSYTPEEYLREIEGVEAKHPNLYWVDYPSHAVEEERRHRQEVEVNFGGHHRGYGRGLTWFAKPPIWTVNQPIPLDRGDPADRAPTRTAQRQAPALTSRSRGRRRGGRRPPLRSTLRSKLALRSDPRT